MNWFYQRYFALFSFIASFSRITAKKSHKSELDFVGLESRVIGLTLGSCLLFTFGILGTLFLLGIWLSNTDVDGTSLNIILILILGFVSIFTISFKYKFEDEIYEVAEHPKYQKMGILTFDLLSILFVGGVLLIDIQLYRLLVI